MGLALKTKRFTEDLKLFLSWGRSTYCHDIVIQPIQSDEIPFFHITDDVHLVEGFSGTCEHDFLFKKLMNFERDIVERHILPLNYLLLRRWHWTLQSGLAHMPHSDWNLRAMLIYENTLLRLKKKSWLAQLPAANILLVSVLPCVLTITLEFSDL